MTIIICKVNSGMCNRLVPFITSYRLATKMGLQYYLHWDNRCSDMDYPYEGRKTTYNDMFENIANVNYINKGQLDAIVDGSVNKLCLGYMQTDLHKYSLSDIAAYDVVYCKDYVHPVYVREDNVSIAGYGDVQWLLDKAQYFKDVQLYFKLLKPVAGIRDRIDEVLKLYPTDRNSIVGFHIRHWPDGWLNGRSQGKTLIAGNYEKRIKMMYDCITENNDVKFYICSTDRNAINDLRNKFGERIIYFENRFGNKEDDKYYTSNQTRSKGNIYKNLNGVVDLFLLSKCNRMVGDVASSYSLCATLLNTDSTYIEL